MDNHVSIVPTDDPFSLNKTESDKTSVRSFAGQAGHVDLACSQEPIHTPGTLQPHGAMLVIDPVRDWAVIAASRNIAEVLHTPLSTDELFGKDVSNLLGARFFKALQTRFQDGSLRGQAPWQFHLEMDDNSRAFNVSVHQHAGLIQVELDPAGAKDQANAQTVISQLQDSIVALREAGNDLEELALVTARGVRRLTGYERVVVYRFDTDWNG